MLLQSSTHPSSQGTTIPAQSPFPFYANHLERQLPKLDRQAQGDGDDNNDIYETVAQRSRAAEGIMLLIREVLRGERVRKYLEGFFRDHASRMVCVGNG